MKWTGENARPQGRSTTIRPTLSRRSLHGLSHSRDQDSTTPTTRETVAVFRGRLCTCNQSSDSHNRANVAASCFELDGQARKVVLFSCGELVLPMTRVDKRRSQSGVTEIHALEFVRVATAADLGPNQANTTRFRVRINLWTGEGALVVLSSNSAEAIAARACADPERTAAVHQKLLYEIPGNIVLADGAYGDSTEFRNTVRQLGFDFAVGVPDVPRTPRATSRSTSLRHIRALAPTGRSAGAFRGPRSLQ